MKRYGKSLSGSSNTTVNANQTLRNSVPSKLSACHVNKNTVYNLTFKHKKKKKKKEQLGTLSWLCLSFQNGLHNHVKNSVDNLRVQEPVKLLQSGNK